jgi:eukaryotic-like serine/threonine-protein kinase
MNQVTETKQGVVKPALDDFSGSTLAGNYLLQKIIGRGGMATVYEAEQVNLKRAVAIKLLRPSDHGMRNDPACMERFLREASCGAALRSPYTVTIYDFGTTTLDNFPVCYIVMERLRGSTLRGVLRTAGTLTPDRAIRIGTQIALAIHEAHQQGFLHRDLKPCNVFLERHKDTADHVKVLDFGLVKNLLESQEDDGLTQHGILLGSPNYMSPEQVRSDTTDCRSDIYALGIILYEMLAGRPPFAQKDNVQILLAHTSKEPPPLLARAPSTPPPLAELIHACLAKNPAERPKSMEELQILLMEIHQAYYPRSNGQLSPLMESDSQLLSGSLSLSLSQSQSLSGTRSLGQNTGSMGSAAMGSAFIVAPPSSAGISTPGQSGKPNASKIAAGLIAALGIVLAVGALSRQSGTAATTAGRGGTRAPAAAASDATTETRVAADSTQAQPSSAGLTRLTARIQSEPLGATVTFGDHTCRTPCEMPLEQGEYQENTATLFTFRKDGYHDTSVSRRLTGPVTNITVTLVEDK